MKKIKDLCIGFPRTETPRNILENLSETIFSIDNVPSYLSSKEEVAPRYSIDINTKYVNLINEYINNFDTLGKNEKYFTNYIFNSQSSIFYLVGGIGVGKTTFLRYFKDEILKQKRHNCSRPCKYETDGGLYFYIDFNKESPAVFSGKNQEKIYEQIVHILCTEIQFQISDKFFTKEEEITDIWDKILKNRDNREEISSISKELQNRLQDLEAYIFKDNFEEVKTKRLSIYDAIRTDKSLHLKYLIELMNYIYDTYLSNHCVFFVIDNIDICPPLVQNTIKNIVRNYLYKKIRAKTIISVRQSTFYELLDNSFSYSTEKIPYCGPDIIEVITQRLNLFLQNPNKYIQGLDIPPKDYENFHKTIRKLILFLEDDKNPLAARLYSALCGHSNRKALLLSKRLLSNSVYNPFSPSSLNVSQVCRALIIGNKACYERLPDSQVENIYSVDTFKEAYLVKLRILKLLYVKQNGTNLMLKQLIEILAAFGYSNEIVRIALNELMADPIRLIWSDSIMNFEDERDLRSAQKAALNLSSAGINYHNYLYKDFNYIQEIALDVYVDPNKFNRGNEFDFRKLNDRFLIVWGLVNLFFEVDKKEFIKFIDRYSYDEYISYFGTTDLITYGLVLDLYSQALNILKSRNTKESVEGAKNIIDTCYGRIHQDHRNIMDQFRIND